MTERSERTLQGLGMAAVFGLILWLVVPAGIAVPQGVAIVSLRPDFWPITLCVLLIALSLGLALTAWFGKRPPAADPCAATAAPGRAERFRPLAVLVLLAAYYAAMQATGLVLPSILACLVLSRLYGARLLPHGLAVSIVLPTALYLFFTRLANVPIPVCGPLQFLVD